MNTSYLYLHGFGEHKDTALKFKELLKREGDEVISIDLRGFGNNYEKQGYINSIQDFKEDIDKALAKLVNDNKILIGYSLGGLIGLHFFLKYENNFSTIVGIAPALGTKLKEPWYANLLSKLALKLYPKLTIRAHILRDEDIARHPLNHDYISAGLYIGIKEMMTEIKNLKVKENQSILILHSVDDSVIDIESSREFVKSHDNIKLIEFDEGLDHFIHIKNPQKAAKVITDEPSD